MTEQEIKQHIRERYGKHALNAQTQVASCCGSGSQNCCESQAQSCCDSYTQRIGYTAE